MTMHQYRIEEREGQFEPQMLYNTGLTDALVWFPLDRQGFWSDPDSYSLGLVRRRSLMSREDAARSVALARSINADVSRENAGENIPY